MNATPENRLQNSSKLIINLISVLIPLTVVILLAFPNKIELGSWTKNLPHAVGLINSVTTLLLLLGLFFIKQNNIRFHRIVMSTAFSLGFVFLICYITYHISNSSNKFAGTGAVRYLYLGVLLTHVLCSFVVLPLVLRAMFYALTGRIEKHKKIVKFAYPIWLYVSATGVIVYLMLYQLYPPA